MRCLRGRSTAWTCSRCRRPRAGPPRRSATATGRASWSCAPTASARTRCTTPTSTAPRRRSSAGRPTTRSPRSPARCGRRGCSSDDDLAELERSIAQEIEAAIEFAEAGTLEPVEDLERFRLLGARGAVSARATTQITYREALREAIREAMLADERVFLMGEDVGAYGGCFGVSRGLLDEFGPDRIRDTPLSESAFVGAGIGAAMGGMRPIVEMMTVNFCLLALDQIMNNAATIPHMSGGQFQIPLVDPHDHRRRAPGRRAALAQPGGLVRAHPRSAAARAGDARRRPRDARPGARRSQPGADLRARLALQHGGRARGPTRARCDIERAAIRRPGARRDADRLRRHAVRRRSPPPRSSPGRASRPR